MLIKCAIMHKRTVALWQKHFGKEKIYTEKTVNAYMQIYAKNIRKIANRKNVKDGKRSLMVKCKQTKF